MIALLLSAVLAAEPVVTVGAELVAGPPNAEAKAQNAWVPVLADCLEEAAPGELAVVDRSRAGVTTKALAKDVASLKALGPKAVVIGVGARETDGDVGAVSDRVGEVIRLLRADGGPEVYLIGMVAPTLSQVPGLDGQEAADAHATGFNAELSKLATADDGVWHVDLWASWPRDAGRERLTEGGYQLTDPAHARIGAVICERILANLRNRGK